jgi:WhiB family redox-sensing transcriptional regulator
MANAACKGEPVTVFFPDEEEHTDYSQARRICAGCPVRDECLGFALKLNIGHGMFGGLSPRQRAIVRRCQRRDAA